MLNALCKDIMLVSLWGRFKLESVMLLAYICLPSPFLPLSSQNQEQRKCGFEKRWKHLFTCGALSLPACLALGFLQLCFLLPWSSSVKIACADDVIIWAGQNWFWGVLPGWPHSKLSWLETIEICRQVSPQAESSCEVLYGSSYNRSPNQNASPIHHNFEIQTFIKLSS